MEDDAEGLVPPGSANADLIDATTEKEGARARDASRSAEQRIKSAPPPTLNRGGGAAPAAPAAASDAKPADPAPSSLRLVSATDPAASTPNADPAPKDDAPPAPPLEERVKALERENQELKAKAAAPAAPAAPEPTATTTTETDNEKVADQVKGEIAADAECRSLAGEFKTNEKRLAEIVTYNDGGVPIGGELVSVATRIHTIEGLLEPDKKGVKGAPSLDEMTKDDLSRQLQDAKSERERLLLEHQRLTARNDTVNDKYQKKAGSIHEKVVTTATARRQAETRANTEREDEKAGHVEWTGAFKAAVPTDLSKEDREWVHTTLLEKANAAFDRGEDIPNFQAWMTKEAPLLLARIGRRQGTEAAATAREKERVTTRQAPTGPASVAAPTSLDNSNLSPRDRRRAAEARTAQMSRRLVLQGRR